MEVPSVRHLECLVAVAEHLNFRRAAEACYITQPALSAQIRQLETLLGIELFERDRRRVLPTPAGAAMAEKARAILSELSDLAEAASAYKAPLTGTLRLGVIPTIAPYLLPRALKGIHAQYPGLRVLIREDQTARLVERLEGASLDVLLLALEADLGGAETLALFEDPFVVALPPRHRFARRKALAESDLFEETVLLLDDGHCLRDQTLSVCERARACELGDFRASSLGTLVQMVAGGVGVTLLPRLALEVETAAVDLGIVPFRSRKPHRTIGLAWRPSSLRKAEYELLGDVIRRGSGPRVAG